ncbi:MAG: hypothetical protein DCC68_07985 [Planctomycetota bacterium]|nr:MAG: hypothetical protein DCC68_07985 [Planctomycetota bacterium]
MDRANDIRRLVLPPGFDFTHHMRRLCSALVRDLDELAHIDVGRVAICFSRARKRVPYGIWASLTPLRFAGGELTTTRGRRTWTIQRLYADDGREMLYILRFYLPRFFDQPLDEKLNTVIHELWHIGPAFDGDLRRHNGRCYAHGASQKQYDAQIDRLLRKWLDARPDPALYEFLSGSMEDLIVRHGGLHGLRVARPRLIPMSRAS